jgi:diguanylate cyclase
MAYALTLFGAIDVTRALEVGLPETAALAAVALIGYLFGHRTRKRALAALNAQRCQELQRASTIAKQLEGIADALRHDLASHHGQLARFKRRLNKAQEEGDEQAWQSLCAEAEAILAPTMQLAQQLSLAYDSIRQQSDALETFTEARTDALTGVGNGRALQEKLDILLTSAKRNGGEFSIALVSLDRDATTATADSDARKKELLPELARLIRSCMRESDFAARFGDEEFVIVMPQTKVPGACIFGDRLRSRVDEQLPETISCGLTEYQAGDDFKSILARADSAYYSAKAEGGNRQFVHTGSQIREHRATPIARPEGAGFSSSCPPLAVGFPTAPLDPTASV